MAAFFRSHNQSGTSWETFRFKLVWGFVASNSIQPLFETLPRALLGKPWHGLAPDQPSTVFLPEHPCQAGDIWSHTWPVGLISSLSSSLGCQQQKQCKIWLKRELLLWFCKEVRGPHLKPYLFASSVFYYGRRCTHKMTAIPSSGWLDWIHSSCHSSR